MVFNRASLFYLGVGKYIPNGAVQGDMGWCPPNINQWSSICRLWCRLVNMFTNTPFPIATRHTLHRLKAELFIWKSCHISITTRHTENKTKLFSWESCICAQSCKQCIDFVKVYFYGLVILQIITETLVYTQHAPILRLSTIC